MKKLESLSIVFPCLNDEKTISSLVTNAGMIATELTDNYEIIIVDDGSKNGTKVVLDKLSKTVPYLRVIYHQKNQGYGKTIKDGLYASKKDWVFYTDGDGQYDVLELPHLANSVQLGVDVVNGFKKKRSDPLIRKLVGYLYNLMIVRLFSLPIRDVDCDFRLIRRHILDKIELTTSSGGFPLELVRKLQKAGARFSEIPVTHTARLHGSSEFFKPRHLLKTAREIMSIR